MSTHCPFDAYSSLEGNTHVLKAQVRNDWSSMKPSLFSNFLVLFVCFFPWESISSFAFWEAPVFTGVPMVQGRGRQAWLGRPNLSNHFPRITTCQINSPKSCWNFWMVGSVLWRWEVWIPCSHFVVTTQRAEIMWIWLSPMLRMSCQPLH